MGHLRGVGRYRSVPRAEREKMKEIKFRQPIIINYKFKRWHYWGFIGKGFVAPETGYSTSQQFTGLKDKYGKEIYEGDIVKWGVYHHLGKVKWHTYEIDGEYNCGYSPFNEIDVNPKYTEVVGNIYETPELLGR